MTPLPTVEELQEKYPLEPPAYWVTAGKTVVAIIKKETTDIDAYNLFWYGTSTGIMQARETRYSMVHLCVITNIEDAIPLMYTRYLLSEYG